MRVAIRPGRWIDVGMSAALESLIQAWVRTFWSLTFLKLHYKITPKHEHASL